MFFKAIGRQQTKKQRTDCIREKIRFNLNDDSYFSVIIAMEQTNRQRNACLTFLADFRALFVKMFLLTKRSVGQTVAELILSCIFLGLVLSLRYVFDRNYFAPYQIPRFRPQDKMLFNGSTANITYYSPGKVYLMTMMTSPCSSQSL